MTYKEMCEGCESKKYKSAGCARMRTREKKDFTAVYKLCSILARGCSEISEERG